MLAYQEFDNELFLLFPNAILKYDLANGTLISEKASPKEYTATSFINNNIFISNGDSYFISPSTELHITTQQGGIMSLDNEINVTKRTENKNIGTTRGAFRRCVF